MWDYNAKIIEEVSQNLLAQGFKVYIAAKGTYGFYTDEKGSKVISFDCDLGSVSASASYKTSNPSKTGTGFRITENFDVKDAAQYLKASAPGWAIGNATYTFTTLEQYLKQYQDSSKFVELTN